MPAHERGGAGERQRKMGHNGAAPGVVFPLSSPWTPWLCKCQEAIRAWRTLSIYHVPGRPGASQGLALSLHTSKMGKQRYREAVVVQSKEAE